MRLFAALLLMVVVCGCDEPSPTIITGQAMGTRYHITLGGGVSAAQADAIALEVSVLLNDIESQASQWREESWVSRFNRSESTQAVAVPEHVWPMLVTAQRVYELSDGALDITAGSLVELWGFGATPAQSPPTEEQLAQVLARCGSDKLVLDHQARTLSKRLPGLAIDLSALGTGYAVDCIAQRLDRRGVSDYLVELGGEIRAKGSGSGGDGWIVQVARPGREAAEKDHRLTLRDQALASSGGSEQHRTLADGTVVTHLIDPRTGRPMSDTQAVITVIAESGIDADAWATALSVTPQAKRAELARRAGVELKEAYP